VRRGLAIAGVVALIGGVAAYLVLREPERDSRSSITEVGPASSPREEIRIGTTPAPSPARVESEEAEEPGRAPRWTDVDGFPTLIELVGADLAEKMENDDRLAREDLPVIGRAVRKMDRLIVEEGSKMDEATGVAINENAASLQRAYYRAVRELVGEDVNQKSAAKLEELARERARLKEEMRDATPEDLAEALGAAKVEILTGEDRAGTR